MVLPLTLTTPPKTCHNNPRPTPSNTTKPKEPTVVKVQGPMLSFDASGTIANTAVFSKWRGRNYVRNRVIPANPRTAPQTGVRSCLKFLAQQWASLSAGNQATWEDRAAQTNILPFNAYCALGLARWRNGEYPSQADPPAEDDTPATMGTCTGQAVGRLAEITAVTTTPADGWGIFLHRSTTTGFTPGYSTLVSAKPHDGTNNVIFEDGPLDPGTYYYKLISGSKNGVKGTASNQVSVTIT